MPLSLKQIQKSIETINGVTDAFDYGDGQHRSITLKNGAKLRDLQRYAGAEVAGAANALDMLRNRYFSEVTIGKYDTEPFLFVIMPFKDSEFPQETWADVMRPALEAKYPDLHAIIADNITDPGKIDNQLYTAILKAKAIIAEVTVRNANVYYELGLAHALDKPVFMLAKHEDGNIDLAFDINQARAEPYDDLDDLRRVIQEKINIE